MSPILTPHELTAQVGEGRMGEADTNLKRAVAGHETERGVWRWKDV